jgi:hypothetical protein
MNISWSWTLKLIIDEIKWTNVETKHHKKYEKHPLKTFTSIMRFEYVLDGRKKKFQDCRCRDVGSHWMVGIL